MSDVPKLRSTSDDLVIYQPYQSPVEGSRDTALRFLKISTTHSPRDIVNEDEEEKQAQPFRILADLGRFSTVFVPGSFSSFIIKSASSPPQVIGLNGNAVKSLSRLNSSTCEKGFVLVDNEVNSPEHVSSTIQIDSK